MTSKQFTEACKEKGVIILNITIKPKSVTLLYRYKLPNDQLSATCSNTYTYHRPALKAIYENHFINANQVARF